MTGRVEPRTDFSATLGLEANAVARPDEARPDDSGVHPGPTRMESWGKAGKVPVGEGAQEVAARIRGFRDLEQHVADLEPGPGSNLAPPEAGYREVLPRASAVDRMPREAKLVDDLLRKQAHCAIGSPVKAQVALTISFETIHSYENRVKNGELRDAAV